MTKKELKNLIREVYSEVNEGYFPEPSLFIKVKDFIIKNKTNKFFNPDIRISGDKNKLSISYSGNIGDSIERDIDPYLLRSGLGTIEDLKVILPKFKESGDMSYIWNITFEVPDKHEWQ